MHHTLQKSIEQLQLEINDTKGRLNAFSFIAQIILDNVKLQDKETYQALKATCLTFTQENFASLGVHEKDIEEQTQAFTEEIEKLFFDEEGLLNEN